MTGRPSKYRPEYDELARNYCLLGATDEQLAQFFEVAPRTIETWKTAHPTFLQALKDGKDLADAQVAMSLYRRATGYSHKAVKIFGNAQGESNIVEYVEHYPPDTTACIFWLKNRQRENWRNRPEAGDAEGESLSITINEAP